MRIPFQLPKLCCPQFSVVLWPAAALFCLGLLARCGQQNEAQVKATSTQEASAPLVKINTNLPALYLERNAFLDLDSAKYHDKLVLQLYHQKDSGLFLLALHPASRKNIVFDETRIKYPKAFANGLDFSDKNIFLGDQQTKKGELEALMNEIRRYSLIRYVLFEPQLDPDNHLFYAITGVEKLPGAFSEKGFRTTVYYSSPTPPAKLH